GAAVCGVRTTSGTASCTCRLLFGSLTAEPLATLVPAVGLSLMTLPAATVLLDCIVTVPRVRPAPVMALVAADCVWPTTFGTATGAGPAHATSLAADAPAIPPPAGRF